MSRQFCWNNICVRTTYTTIKWIRPKRGEGEPANNNNNNNNGKQSQFIRKQKMRSNDSKYDFFLFWICIVLVRLCAECGCVRARVEIVARHYILPPRAQAQLLISSARPHIPIQPVFDKWKKLETGPAEESASKPQKTFNASPSCRPLHNMCLKLVFSVTLWTEHVCTVTNFCIGASHSHTHTILSGRAKNERNECEGEKKWQQKNCVQTHLITLFDAVTCNTDNFELMSLTLEKVRKNGRHSFLLDGCISLGCSMDRLGCKEIAQENG